MVKFLLLLLIAIFAVTLVGCGEQEPEPDPDIVQLSDKDAGIVTSPDTKGFHDRFSEYKWVVRLDKDWDDFYYSDSEPKIELSSGTGGALICMESAVIFQRTFDEKFKKDYKNVLYPYGHCIGTGKHEYHIYRQK